MDRDSNDNAEDDYLLEKVIKDIEVEEVKNNSKDEEVMPLLN